MNRLADSLSPYLLQHKNNPVDWFPWCDEAFERAKETDRPIFLSVGYAACHWCHVMEHESFENESIAAFLNDSFVSIKVDREERPDIDQIYMNAVQVMTGHGGWPMSVFLNHDRQPFYAGTYWPAAAKFGMPSFAQVLDALADAWNNRREEIEKHAGEITAALRQLAIGTSTEVADLPGDSIIDDATDRLLGALDRTDGGFGTAPKFPHATDLDLLIRRSAARATPEASSPTRPEMIAAVELTLDRMAGGGIFDHVGGGFARYSVDAKWLVPHFEKMLYDNALLAEVYVRAFQVTGHDRHATVACEVLDYLCRDMVDQAGGFHCSEDADSEGVEGKYYVWTPEEVAEVLGSQRGDRFCQIYDITESGNFEGKSIPNLPRPLNDWAEQWSIDAAELAEQLADDRRQLLQAREKRVRPGRDDKVLTAWNSLAVKALAVAGAVLDRPRYIDAALRAAQFTVETMMQPDNRLLHAFRGGRAHLDAYVDDYAYTIEAFVSLFEATGEPEWIGHASRLADTMLAQFEDPRGGFFYTATDAESLITRNKDWHDGSLVGGNASAVMSLLKLSHLCDRDDYAAAAERTFRIAGEVLTKQSAACGGLLSALDRYLHADEQLVIAVGDHDQLAKWRPEVLKRYRPHTTFSWVVGDSSDSESTIALNRERNPIDNDVTLYRCQHFRCELPLAATAAIDWLSE